MRSRLVGLYHQANTHVLESSPLDISRDVRIISGFHVFVEPTAQLRYDPKTIIFVMNRFKEQPKGTLTWAHRPGKPARWLEYG
jgi:hypothetical protein